jgi:hypothetical protein
MVAVRADKQQGKKVCPWKFLTTEPPVLALTDAPSEA